MQNQEIITQALHAADHPILLENKDNLDLAEGQWNQSEILGIDTEFLRERTYRAELGLVQISDGRTAWLIDVTQINELDALRRLFENRRILKVFHSASEDFEVLWNTLRVLPEPVTDTQIGCAMLGHPLQMSYHNAVKWLTGVEIDKDQTRSNWLQRPLSARQLHYAATDVVFLPMLCRELQEKLVADGKWSWLEEDVQLLLQQSYQTIQPNEAYLRLAGAANLDGKGLKVLQELAAWRENMAIERNLARGFVVKDPVLLHIAKQRPETPEDLSKIEGIHPKTVQKHGESLLAAVRRGLESTTVVQVPDLLESRQKKILSAMRKSVAVKAAELNVDPALLASKKILENLLRAFDGEENLPKRLQGWRYELFTRNLIQIIEREG